MRRNSTSSIGALHPVLFFMLVYGISLFLALFVCRTVYYSINDDASRTSQNTIQKLSNSTTGVTASLK